MIELRNVSKWYGNKKVIDSISLTIPRGRITSFIGPNGAGKSTLLSLMSRLLGKDSGEILIDGQEIGQAKSNELAKKVSILKQSNHLHIRLKVKELVSFGRFPYSQGRLSPEDWKHVEKAMEYMELEDLQDKYLDQLSGGQRQRAFIAMVLAQDTDYIFLDEPLNNLDMKHSVQIMKMLRKLADDLRKTIVLVLHDINFASCYSDYIVALKDGKVVKAGSTGEMIDAEVLKSVFEMDILIQKFDQHKVSIYYL
ncbi:MAG: iron ABC transporter ATP-binding protein [Bacillus thermozeamaize]|uniref:Iron ABC transporter ATP-binding protein n=1 Tax=Bacillus thermozeamaize TaxID=230954 RepID=A0A1Y3PFB3_9BACI|nr:MAG: iron ABC transporter ATP-binding protein [Bacillus thermozeamaize]